MRFSSSAAAAVGVVLAISAAAFGGTAVAPTTSGNLVLNGSFEMPVIPSGAFEQTKVIYGWDGLSGLELQSNGVLGPTVGGTPFGNQYDELNVIYPSKLVQIVPTTVGDTYLLSFYLAERPGTGTNAISVFMRGTTAETYTLPATSTLTFDHFTETVTATEPWSVLSFNPVKSNFLGAGNELDNVSLTLISAPADVQRLSVAGAASQSAVVPLPSAFWLGLTGLAALALAGVCGKRRRTI